MWREISKWTGGEKCCEKQGQPTGSTPQVMQGMHTKEPSLQKSSGSGERARAWQPKNAAEITEVPVAMQDGSIHASTKFCKDRTGLLKGGAFLAHPVEKGTHSTHQAPTQNQKGRIPKVPGLLDPQQDGPPLSNGLPRMHPHPAKKNHGREATTCFQVY